MSRPADRPQAAPSSPLLAAWRLVLLLPLLLGMHALFALRVLPLWRSPRRHRIGAVWVRAGAGLVCRLLGLELRGTLPPLPEGAMLAPNHSSYMDIFALASRVPCLFTPKDDIRRWPVVGAMVALSGHPFIRRRRGRKLLQAGSEIRERLEQGVRVCVFLEGTTSGGDRLLPFKSALLQPAIEAGAPLVPIALRYGARDSRIEVSEDIAYWKDHVIGPHLWRLAGLRGIWVEIRCGEAISTAGTTRQELAQSLRRAVAELGEFEEDSESGEAP